MRAARSVKANKAMPTTVVDLSLHLVRVANTQPSIPHLARLRASEAPRRARHC